MNSLSHCNARIKHLETRFVKRKTKRERRIKKNKMGRGRKGGEEKEKRGKEGGRGKKGWEEKGKEVSVPITYPGLCQKGKNIYISAESVN